MVRVTKILETTISSGGTTATFTDADIPNSLIRVYSTDSNIYPQTMSLSGNTLTVTYEAVTSTLGVVLELVKQGLVINDTLTSTATDEALSANQGRALKAMIDNLGVPALTELSDIEITSLADGDIIQYDSDTSKFINTPLTISTNLTDLDDVNVTSIQDGQVLAWDSDSSKFVNVDQGSASITLTTKAWTATSSTAANTVLTESATLSPGLYMINVHTPYSSSTNMQPLGLYINNALELNTIASAAISYGNFTHILEIVNTSTLAVCSVSSTSMSWDSAYLSRDGINIIKLS